MTTTLETPAPTTSAEADSAVLVPHRGLTPEPALGPMSDFARRGFRVMNHWFMVPMLRAGLGPWMGTPLGGWILLLRVRGRKSGLVRANPLSYLVADGAAWVMAGFGGRTEWYRNLRADARVEVVLPGRTFVCSAEVVDDPEVRRRIIPRLVRATGLPGFLVGCNPYRSSDERLLAATAWVPLIRLRPASEPICAGSDDPGGLGWVWRQAVVVLAGAWLVGRVRRLLR